MRLSGYRASCGGAATGCCALILAGSACVAGGLSNAEIADQLVLSPLTIKTHVARILDKLDLRDRIQAVVLAYETGIVRPGTRQPHLR